MEPMNAVVVVIVVVVVVVVIVVVVNFLSTINAVFTLQGYIDTISDM